MVRSAQELVDVRLHLHTPALHGRLVNTDFLCNLTDRPSIDQSHSLTALVLAVSAHISARKQVTVTVDANRAQKTVSTYPIRSKKSAGYANVKSAEYKPEKAVLKMPCQGKHDGMLYSQNPAVPPSRKDLQHLLREFDAARLLITISAI